MANFMLRLFRAGTIVTKNVSPGTLSGDQNFLKCINARFLYSEQSLGLDKYREKREKLTRQFSGLKKTFFNRMRENITEERQSTVFKKDFKSIFYIAENTPEDIELCVLLMKKFHEQNKESKFGFGPVAMRWLHCMDKPDLALQLLNNEELSGIFDQITSYQVAMDLLFKHKRYQDVLNVFEHLQNKNFLEKRYPRSPVVLALGSCYHLNTPESYQKSIGIIQGASFKWMPRRGLTFAATLALRQGHPDIALKMLSLNPYTNYITVRNLRLQVLAELNHLEDIFPILRQVIDKDISRFPAELHKDICQETLDCIQKKLDESRDKEMLHIFEQICRTLRESNHITVETLDQLLNLPIQVKFPHRGDRDVSYSQNSTSRPSRSYNAYRGESQRQMKDAGY